MAKTAHGIAAALGSHDVVLLESASLAGPRGARAELERAGLRRHPAAARAFGISASQVSPRADIFSMRPGLSGLTKMQLLFVRQAVPGGVRPGSDSSLPLPASCLANPVIQEVSACRPARGAQHRDHAAAISTLRLRTSGRRWLADPDAEPAHRRADQNARLAAAAAGLTIETKNSIPSVGVIIDWATVFGVLALGILAMTLGLIRSETARDLRTLAATGASRWTRRTLTGVTAGALGVAGAVLGTVAAYVAAIGYTWDIKLDGLSVLKSVPTASLLRSWSG